MYTQAAAVEAKRRSNLVCSGVGGVALRNAALKKQHVTWVLKFE